MDQTGLQCLLLFFHVMNVVLHGLGTHLLICIYRRVDFKVQYVNLISLSICELVINFIGSIRVVLGLVNDTNQYPVLQDVNNILYIANATGFSLIFYFNMIYITLDRLLAILLALKYPVYWDEYKAAILLKVTWLFGVIVLVLCCVFFNDSLAWEAIVFKFVYPVLQFPFIILALFTYVFIFRKFKVSRKPPVILTRIDSSKTVVSRQNSTFEALKHSRFYISVLLIFTFIVFMIVPDLIYLFHCVLFKTSNCSSTVLTACWVSYGVANISDAIIYIFLQVEVKALLLKKVRKVFGNKPTWRNCSTSKVSQINQKEVANILLNNESNSC